MAERKQEQTQQRSESSDLKQREYRDKEGDVHHHTHEYMERHKGEKGRGDPEHRQSEESKPDEEE